MPEIFPARLYGLCHARGFGLSLRLKIRQPSAGTEDSPKIPATREKKISYTQGILDKFKEDNT